MKSGTELAAALPPPTVPFYRAVPGFLRDPAALCTAAWREKGDVVRLSLGVTDAVVLSHPDHIRHVLQEQHKRYGKGRLYGAVRKVLGHGLVTSEGETWLSLRRLMQPSFHRERLDALVETLVGTIDHAFDASWSAAASSAVPLPMTKPLRRATAEIMTRATLGAHLRTGDFEAATDALDTINGSLQLAMLFSLVPAGIPTPNVKWKKAVETVDDVVLRVIEHCERSGEQAHLLSMLIAARDADTGEAMSPEELTVAVRQLFLAGYETTAAALLWTFYALTQHPDVEKRVLAEIADVLGDRPPTYGDLAKLDYTTRVINESMRFYASAWAIPREAIEDDVVGGFRVPKGTLVIPCPRNAHQHPGFWNNPGVFDPEHFSPEQTAARPRHAFVPFGFGPRVCIGNAFAMMEMKLIVAMALQRYEFSLAHPVTRAKSETVLVVPDPELRLTIRSRKASASRTAGPSTDRGRSDGLSAHA
ncbi:MAG TPA: cytochrome P450 [Labilithrix sp.]|nr:cytochrome P450 [Labilithrix sp.]